MSLGKFEIGSRTAFLEVAVDAAHEAGALLRGHTGRTPPYELKSSHQDLVTESDRVAEARILARIREAFPDHAILSEERPEERSRSPFRWVIDPIDGTTNYAHGVPFYSISIALERDDALIAGVVYDPDRGELFAALGGRGATLNGHPIAVSAEAELKRGVLATGFPHVAELRELNLRYFERLIPAAQGLRRLGSAALSLAYVACGRLDGYWDLDLNRWDLAAGVLLVSEAGGRVSDLDGRDLAPDGRRLVASNGGVHDELVRTLGA